MLRYGESVFTKESQGIEFFVIIALDYYVNSGQLLNYIYTVYRYIYIFAREVVCIECVLLKKSKTPCYMRGIPSNIHQVIKPMDYN